MNNRIVQAVFSRCICFAQIYRVNDDSGEKFEGGSSADFSFVFFICPYLLNHGQIVSKF